MSSGADLVAAIGCVVASLYLRAAGSAYALSQVLVIAMTALIPLVGTTLGAMGATPEMLAHGLVPWGGEAGVLPGPPAGREL